ncbi:FAD-binding protein [Streptomyces sp. AK02-01A]|uniref:FAD-binding protein n=1 Tax=Streptomyces sp. AK02-01A TaxID=3028648 RepID=UPI0029A327A4|nr:FAD-binding protein [Streptomyces sp. AK02-01A]MDX3854590.1 FAD-binding protein [Streptomyces sp. AK02-01A]
MTNWARNITFNAARVHRPSSVERLREIVAGGPSVRALGSGHSFNRIADTDGDLVSVAELPRTVEVDRAAATVTVSGGLRFAEFTGAVHDAGLALHNLGSLPHISVAGACATGTHGSGVGNGALASAVRALDIVTADGEILSLARGDKDFAGAVVALGAAGIVTRMTLDLVPAYDIRQWVYEGLPYGRLRERFDDILSAAYSVSLFTRWRTDLVEQIWLKHRVGDDERATALAGGLGAEPADGPRHPVPGMDPVTCTEQSGVAGPWHERLPHFRPEFTPSNGEELQSEYFVAREDGLAAFDALARVRDRIAPVLQIGEIRTVAADEYWLSPAYGRDSVAFHFTWIADTAAVTPVLGVIEEALAPFGVRPHWGKLFTMAPERVRALYERSADFETLLAKLDPRGTFRNDFITRYFPGDQAQRGA